MDEAWVDQQWESLCALLPSGWQQLARDTGALKRARQIPDAETLLRLILQHVAADQTLEQTVLHARMTGLAELSDVAFLRRLRAAEPWLQKLTSGLVFSRDEYQPSWGRALQGRRVRVLDATPLQQPASTGCDWRVHLSLSLPSCEVDFAQVTDAHGGESFKRLPVEAGDVVLGDRVYARRDDVAQVCEQGGDVVVRLNLQSFPLLDSQGRPFAILPALRTLTEHQPGEWPVGFKSNGTLYPARLCAVRKDPAQTDSARKRLRTRASKKGNKLKPSTLEAAGYILVLTTVPREQLATDDVLQLYRARWQVELGFKRLKSLLHLGHLPKKTPSSARAWIQAKLLTALLTERLMYKAHFFFPWSAALPAPVRLV